MWGEVWHKIAKKYRSILSFEPVRAEVGMHAFHGVPKECITFWQLIATFWLVNMQKMSKYRRRKTPEALT
jgi:hypothetical protein